MRLNKLLNKLSGKARAEKELRVVFLIKLRQMLREKENLKNIDINLVEEERLENILCNQYEITKGDKMEMSPEENSEIDALIDYISLLRNCDKCGGCMGIVLNGSKDNRINIRQLLAYRASGMTNIKIVPGTIITFERKCKACGNVKEYSIKKRENTTN